MDVLLGLVSQWFGPGAAAHIASYAVLMPESVLGLAALLLLVVGTFVGKEAYKVVYGGAVLAVVGALCATTLHYDFNEMLNKHYLVTSSILSIKGLVLTLALFVLLLSADLAKRNARVAVFEYPVLFLVCILGMLISVSAPNSLVLYMGLEIQALALYVMVALDRDDLRASEAGLRYYLLGSAASALILFGFSFLYGVSGTFDLSLGAVGGATNQLIYVAGAIFVIGGLCFKIAAFPMHAWVPDVYHGASSVVTTFIATVPKMVAFVVLSRFLNSYLGSLPEAVAGHLKYAVQILALGSIAVGLLGALRQSKIKRLLAYSSIQHMGYLLLLAPMAGQLEVALSYVVVYSALVIGVFACLMNLVGDDRRIADLEISDLAGLASRDRCTAFVLMILLLSLAGIPPVAGFFAKLFLFSAALQEQMHTAVVVAALLSVAAMYYYLNVIKVMFFDEMNSYSLLNKVVTGKTRLMTLLIFGALLFNFALLLRPGAVLRVL